MNTPPRTPRALGRISFHTCVQLSPEGRLKLDRLTAAHDSHLMRVVISDALDLLYSKVFCDTDQDDFTSKAITYRYKEQSDE